MRSTPPDWPATSRPPAAAAGSAIPGRSRPEPAPAGPSLAARWAALHEAAQVIAAIAGDPAPRAADGGNLAEAAARGAGWRLRLIDQQVEDLGAILTHGISALLAAHERDPAAASAPARALLGEFLAARRGILSLCPPGKLEQRRLG